MPRNIDRYMSRLNERLMSCEQRSLDEINYILDDMQNLAEQCPEREDMQACIDEVKAKCKKAATESWAVANHWSEHFDGLGGDTEESKKEDAKVEEEQVEATDDADEE